MVTTQTGTQPTETPAQRFKRIANKRIARAEYDLGLIGNMTGTTYEKTPAQVDEIEKFLHSWVKNAVSNLRLGRGKVAEHKSYV